MMERNPEPTDKLLMLFKPAKENGRMKYLAILTVLTMTVAHAQVVKPNALEDEFRLDPTLKPGIVDYSEKNVTNGKLFKVNSQEEFKLTKSKPHPDKLEIYQLKMEEINGKVKKVESYVELEKQPLGKVRSITKCGIHGTKGGCQQYTKPFCRKLINDESLVESKPVSWWKDVYKDKEVFNLKSEILRKLTALHSESKNDLGEDPVKRKYKEKLAPIYPNADSNFDKQKIIGDIRKCKEIIAEFKEDRVNSQSTSRSAASSSEQ